MSTFFACSKLSERRTLRKDVLSHIYLYMPSWAGALFLDRFAIKI